MENALLGLLPSDPVTLKSIAAGCIASYAVIVPGLIAWFHLHYKGRIETAHQLVTLGNAQLADCRDKLHAAQPGVQLALIKDHQALLAETYGIQVRALEEAKRDVEAQKAAIEAVRDAEVASVQQRQDQSAELARLDREKAKAEARIQELEGFIDQAHRLARGLEAAALRRAARERQEYEAKKDTIEHRFVKHGDAREEFEALRQRASSDGRVSSDRVTVAVYGEPRSTFTQVNVVGHDWYVFMQEQRGWSLFKPSDRDFVAPAVIRWARAYAQVLHENGGRDPSLIMVAGGDCIEMRIHDRLGTCHSLAILATITGGSPTPMAHYESGTQAQNVNGVRAWRREHGTGLGK